MSKFKAVMKHDCAPFDDECEKRSVDGSALDRHQSPLLTGKILFNPENSGGTFFPDNELPSGRNSIDAAILKSADGREFLLDNFLLCSVVGRTHYEFTLRKTA